MSLLVLYLNVAHSCHKYYEAIIVNLFLSSFQKFIISKVFSVQMHAENSLKRFKNLRRYDEFQNSVKD